MQSIVVIGVGVYALSLTKAVGLFFPTCHLPFGVLAGSERLIIKNHLATLQETNSLILCCAFDTQTSAVAIWIKSLRDACVRAEILILTPSAVSAQSLRNAPLLCDRRGVFKMDEGPGLRISSQDVSLGSIIVSCNLAKKCTDACWQRLVRDSALERARQLYSTCERRYLETGGTQEVTHPLRDLAAVLLGKDLVWESILELDPHNPVFPEKFERTRSRLSLAASRSDIEFEETWDAVRELFAFTEGGHTEA